VRQRFFRTTQQNIWRDTNFAQIPNRVLRGFCFQFTGSGDVTAATFLANLLRAPDLPSALARTAAVIYGLLKITTDTGRTELALIAAQDEYVRPSYSFEPVRLR